MWPVCVGCAGVLPHSQSSALGTPGKLPQAPVVSAPKPSCRGLWVRPGQAPEAKKAGLEGWPVWGMSPAALPPCPLCLYWSVCPPLPQCSLLSASALGPEQAGPGMLGPIHSVSFAQMPLLFCSWTCRPCLHSGHSSRPSPDTCWTPPPTARGLEGRAGRGLLTRGLWSLSACSRCTPGPQRGLPRARGPLLAQHSPHCPRFPPGQRDQHRQPGVGHG